MTEERFDLLLQDPDGEDALPGGISGGDGALGEDPERKIGQEEAPDTLGSYASLNSLSQGWGVLYPEGREDLRDVIEPLRARREAAVHAAWVDDDQQGPPPPVQAWAIPAHWTAEHFVSAIYDKLSFEHKPRYLLILGDFHEIPVSFQCDLAGRAAVGRLCFPTLDGYRAYVEKLEENETTPAPWREARLLLYSTSSSLDSDRSVDNGHAHLIETTRAHFASWRDHNPFNPGSVELLGPRGEPGKRSWSEMSALSADGRPSLLLSLSHGAGRSRWTAAEQMEQQGRVKLDRRTMLDPVEVGEKAFLPGGVWFLFACFGAGTPKETAFQAWLDQLYQLDHYATSPNVRRTLAKERPFVAATPMAALANPRGPLAVFAHADLAFSYGYAKLPGQENLTLAGGQGSVANPFEGGQPFVSNTLQHLGRGQRAGFAMHELDRVVQWLETALTSDADQDAQSTNEMAGRVLELSHQPPGQGGELIPEAIRDAAKLALSEVGNPKKVTLPLIAARARMTPDELRAALGQRFTEFAKAGEAMVAISHKWMARNDVRAFILLGDPAVDLALEKTRPKKDVEDWGFPMPPRPEPEPTPTPASSFGAAIAPEVAEKIVMDLLSGEASPRQASRQHGLTVEQVNELERVYTEAGKRALERLLKG